MECIKNNEFNNLTQGIISNETMDITKEEAINSYHKTNLVNDKDKIEQTEKINNMSTTIQEQKNKDLDKLKEYIIIKNETKEITKE